MVDDPQDMACQELVEVITDYLEGHLPEPDRGRFEYHLTTCKGCRNYVEQIRTTIRLSGRLAHGSMSPEARANLLRLFRGWTRERRLDPEL